MRYLALARFRLLTLLRSSTPIFVICLIPCVFGSLALAMITESNFRLGPWELQPSCAVVAVIAWVMHGIFITFATISSGKVKSAHDDMTIGVKPDLMDTAPVSSAERFWGDALGTFGAMAIIHLCTLPLLATIAALDPLPTSAFVWIEAVILAAIFLGSASAAWQRRAPRTKFSATRGARNALVVAILMLLAFACTSRLVAFRDAFLTFIPYRVSRNGWADLMDTIEAPALLVLLLLLLYAGTMTYYYVSATRKRALEN